MIDKKKIISEIYKRKIIAIFRGIAPQKCVSVAKALYDGGITMMEVTFDQKEADRQYESTLESIRNISEIKPGNILVGAGTVMTTKQVVLAYNAGAQYIITPTLDENVIELAKELGMVTLPGAFTASEVNRAYQAGADLVKIFPLEEVGASYLKALQGPLGHIPMVAVGGVNIHNAKQFIDAGAVALGIGGNLVDKKLIQNDDYTGLTKLAQKYTENIL